MDVEPSESMGKSNAAPEGSLVTDEDNFLSDSEPLRFEPIAKEKPRIVESSQAAVEGTATQTTKQRPQDVFLLDSDILSLDSEPAQTAKPSHSTAGGKAIKMPERKLQNMCTSDDDMSSDSQQTAKQTPQATNSSTSKIKAKATTKTQKDVLASDSDVLSANSEPGDPNLPPSLLAKQKANKLTNQTRKHSLNFLRRLC
jgi:hypothetical protein